MNSNLHPYQNLQVLLATKHHKGMVVAPEFESALGMKVEELHVDTDVLGTFSGEIERVGTAKETVIAKAHLAIEAGVSPYALASEGSVGVDPLIPFINSDIEHMAFIDTEREITLVETIRSTEIIAKSIKLQSLHQLENFLEGADFPRHKLIIRTTETPTAYCVKGIDDFDILRDSIATLLRSHSEIIVESDLRAHCSPTRMANIAQVARKLAKRLSNLCPECQAPGWGVVGFFKGLPCTECGEISEEALRAEIWGCVKCSFTQEGKILADSIDPSRCDLCNP